MKCSTLKLMRGQVWVGRSDCERAYGKTVRIKRISGGMVDVIVDGGPDETIEETVLWRDYEPVFNEESMNGYGATS